LTRQPASQCSVSILAIFMAPLRNGHHAPAQGGFSTLDDAQRRALLDASLVEVARREGVAVVGDPV
jgi:hypothetical protein